MEQSQTQLRLRQLEQALIDNAINERLERLANAAPNMLARLASIMEWTDAYEQSMLPAEKERIICLIRNAARTGMQKALEG